MTIRLAKELAGFLATHTPVLPKAIPVAPIGATGSDQATPPRLKNLARQAVGFALKPAELDRAVLWSATHAIPAYFRPRPKSTVTAPTIEEYRSRAEAYLHGASTPARRNAAITGSYARLFAENPTLFPWCGLAAFASRQVGIGIRFWRLPDLPFFGPDELVPDAIWDRLSPPVNAIEEKRLNELLIAGNDAVFAHIFPVFLAYRDGGYERVKALAIEPELKAAFLMIDLGREAWQSGDFQRARTYTRRGNDLLLRFEQEITLQPLVYDGAAELWRKISKSRVLHMRLELGRVPDRKHWTFFSSVVPGGNIAVFADRWSWITKGLLPLWETLQDENLAAVHHDMQRLIRAGEKAKGEEYPE